MDAVDVATTETGSEPLAVATPAGAGVRYRAPRSLLRWVRGGGLTTLLFVLPLLVIFGIFSWYPIVRTVIISFERTNLIDYTWVGLDNFRYVLHDPLLPIAIKNTAYFALLALIFGYPIPLVAAVLMSEVRRRRSLYAGLVYLPVVLPPVVAVLLWLRFYNGESWGVFNTILSWVHLGPYPWLSSQQMAMPSLVLESTWANAGTTVIIYLAALTGVNSELYEAASVDGASIWKKVWHITMPQLRGVMLVTLILQIIATAQVFLEPYLFTGGGPNYKTLTVLLLIFDYAFGSSVGANYGAATALSLMLAAFLALFSLIYLRATRSWSNE